MTREIVGRKGYPGGLKEVEGKFITEKRLLNPEYSLPESEFRGMLAFIDFRLLEKVFRTIADQSGLDSSSFNFLDASHIHQSDNAFGGAFFVPEANIICLNAKSVKDGIETCKNEYTGLPADEILLKLITLLCVIHEQVHAISYTKFENWKEDLVKSGEQFRNGEAAGTFKDVQSGYHSYTYVKDSPGQKYHTRHSNFAYFDEGVTEKLAREIMLRYLAEDKFVNSADLNKFLNFVDNAYSGYAQLVSLVEAMVKKVSKNAGLEEKTVWQAFIRSKLEGVDFIDQDLVGWIDEHTFDNFVDSLKSFGSSYASYGGGQDKIASCIKRLSL